MPLINALIIYVLYAIDLYLRVDDVFLKSKNETNICFPVL